MDVDYTYKVVEVIRIVDADTFWLTLERDVGFRTLVRFPQEFRLDEWDCPEKTRGSAYERAQARVAQAATAEFFSRPLGTLWVRSRKDPDNFGRYFAIVKAGLSFYDPDAISLGESLAEHKLAVTWPTRWWQTYDPQGRG
jgi:Micrococcal nuclease (thermonuclease) homologs